MKNRIYQQKIGLLMFSKLIVHILLNNINNQIILKLMLSDFYQRLTYYYYMI